MSKAIVAKMTLTFVMDIVAKLRQAAHENQEDSQLSLCTQSSKWGQQ